MIPSAPAARTAGVAARDDRLGCLLVGVGPAGRPYDESNLDELAALAESAGFRVDGRHALRRAKPDAALFIGRGAADRIQETLRADAVDVVVFDNALGAVQQRNLGEQWQLPVLDRTELILEIFSRRAQSREGKLQVELARLEHLSARLVRGWTHLERQRGGIGARGGPGEKQVELDRRMLRARVKRLRADLEQVRRQRANRRRARERSGVFRVSLVGYTNAGKSTLFNRLSGAASLSADQLFATLDTLTRRVMVAPGVQVMLSDTVGFVRDLPHALVDAFKATLEETAQADLLLHVIDASAPDRAEQIHQVQQVLREIGADGIPIIEVLNKTDRLPADHLPATRMAAPEQADELAPCDSIAQVPVSALTGAGIDVLRRAIARQAAAPTFAGAGHAGHDGVSPPSDASNADDRHAGRGDDDWCDGR
ncbi:MAG: GTPase HflX [Burkholderiaceae bacterium]